MQTIAKIQENCLTSWVSDAPMHVVHSEKIGRIYQETCVKKFEKASVLQCNAKTVAYANGKIKEMFILGVICIG